MSDIPANDPIGPLDLHAATSFEDFQQRVRHNGGLISGGPVDLHTFKGWAIRGHARSHFFKPCTTGRLYPEIDSVNGKSIRVFEFVALCGVHVPAWEQWSLFGAGNYPHCARCVAVFNRRRGRV